MCISLRIPWVWEAVSLASSWSIPTFRTDFLCFTSKIVEHSHYLLHKLQHANGLLLFQGFLTFSPVGVALPSLICPLLLACCHLVVRMLSWGAPRATLPVVFTGGDAAVVRGVGADRRMRMGHRARLVVWSPARIPELR